jgi:hypothetical protein
MTNKSTLMSVLGYSMIACYTGLVLSLIFLEIPQANKSQLIHMEGILEGCILAMISYYFGDSESKKEQNEKNSNSSTNS